MICSADTNQINLECFNSAKLKILNAKSGSQSRNICQFQGDLTMPYEGSCHEIVETLKFLKKKY